LAQRLQGNREVEGYLQRRLETAAPLAPSHAWLPSSLRAACELTATQAALWLARGQHPELEGRLVSLTVLGLERHGHALVRRPQCPACGDPARGAAPRPVTLASRPKAFTADGGHRSAGPERMLAEYEHHVSPITGAVASLVRVPADPEGRVHVYMAGHDGAHPRMQLAVLRQSLRHKAVGKGATDAQAKASALGEALERASGRFRGDEPRTTASYRQLGDLALHPSACMLYSAKQYAERAAWNAHGAAARLVPDPLDEEAAIEWSPLWSLTEERFKYLPTQYLYSAYPHAPGQFYAWADSNGCAAGGSLEEAILQGLLELVERDAVALWWYSRARRPGVDLAGFGDPAVGELVRAHRALGRQLWALDLTSDLGIPTFAAVSRRIAEGPEQLILGFGAHLEARIGLLRALTEAGQFLPTVQRLEGYPHPDPELAEWWQTATVAAHPYLLPDAGRPARTAAAYPRQWAEDVAADVRACQQIVEAKGLELLVLDQSRPDLGLAVVKVVVPGLRFFWPRLAPGRLYEVPVRLGWLQRPLAEEELNPTPLLI
jgi:ribosomal protein S12 methylthiotransferase accessory factor